MATTNSDNSSQKERRGKAAVELAAEDDHQPLSNLSVNLKNTTNLSQILPSTSSLSIGDQNIR